MPYRKEPIVTGQFYHVCNRGIDKRSTFTDKREYKRAMEIVSFYHFSHLPLKLSRYLTLPNSDQIQIMKDLIGVNKKVVSIVSFCLMPNHFHFLLQQMEDSGVSKFLSQLQNSYTRYFNTKHERIGPLFLDQFKAVRIETDEQLLHVCRYIHLNPYTSYVVKSLIDLESYPWSSFPEYMDPDKEGICDKDLILSFFETREDYKQFVFNNADYQRELDKIKHLTLE